MPISAQGIDLTRPHKTTHTGCSVSPSKCLQVYPSAAGSMLYCHACKEKLWIPFEGKHSEYVQRKAQQEKQAELNKLLQSKDWSLPEDFSRTLPAAELAWLTKCGWGPELINKNNIGWSEKLQRTIIPLSVGWQGRSNAKGTKQKWHTQTPQTYQFYLDGATVPWPYDSITSTSHNCIVVVEDVMSAARISKFHLTLCTMGTPKKPPISTTGKTWVLWFDADPAGQAAYTSWKQDLTWGNDVGYIWTKKDPKLHTDEEIRKIVCEQ